MWLGISISLAVTLIVLFVGIFSNRFVPGAQNIETRERLVYSIILSLLSLLISITITLNNETHQQISETHQKIRSIEGVFTTLSDSHMKPHFTNIFTHYHKHFSQGENSPILTAWAHRKINFLSTEMQQESVSLPNSIATEELTMLYSESAQRYIFATHVGSLEEYTTNRMYWEAENRAYERKIPVIRFFIFDGEKQEQSPKDENSNKMIMTYVRSDGTTLEQYSEEVSKLHEKMNTLISMVISKGDYIESYPNPLTTWGTF